ncbi:MAG: caspase family protein [Bacteroidetes bacterium]|nr:caspase family protein [Bacteroidota bacterium]
MNYRNYIKSRIKSLKGVLMILFLILSIQSFSQSFIGIVVANTNDSQIGKSCDFDKLRMIGEFNTIANSIKYKLELKQLSGGSFNFENLQSTLDKLSCTPNDVIFFYYTGHGHNSNDLKTSWPSLDLSGGMMPLELVHEKLTSKGAHLTITMGDCCNKVNASTPVAEEYKIIESPSQDQLSNINNLFIDPNINILVSSSKRGQSSYAHPENGSYFTTKWIEALHKMVNYSKTLNWNILLNETSNMVSNELISGYSQIPQFDISTQNVKAVIPVPNPSPEPSPIIPTPLIKPEDISYTSVSAYLNDIIDQSKSKEHRKDMVKYASNLFVNDGVVEIYKGTTLVELQAYNEYFMRVYINGPDIRTINFIESKSERASNGIKYRKIAVQEIWK